MSQIIRSIFTHLTKYSFRIRFLQLTKDMKGKNTKTSSLLILSINYSATTNQISENIHI